MRPSVITAWSRVSSQGWAQLRRMQFRYFPEAEKTGPGAMLMRRSSAR